MPADVRPQARRPQGPGLPVTGAAGAMTIFSVRSETGRDRETLDADHAVAVLLEPIQGESGFVPLSDAYLPLVRVDRPRLGVASRGRRWQKSVTSRSRLPSPPAGPSTGRSAMAACFTPRGVGSARMLAWRGTPVSAP
ncbi:MAG: hypothetical protein ACYCS9_10030 [Candidatus Dormibacteria bacterium]